MLSSKAELCLNGRFRARTGPSTPPAIETLGDIWKFVMRFAIESIILAVLSTSASGNSAEWSFQQPIR